MTGTGTAVQAHRKSLWQGQTRAAVHTGVSQGTTVGILQNDHIPLIETLFRLADDLSTDPIQIFPLVGPLQRAAHPP
jgi:hypothetical protein